ncbi:hypothetical protein ACWEOG_17045 [Amycolatopsis japonica]
MGSFPKLRHGGIGGFSETISPGRPPEMGSSRRLVAAGQGGDER